MWFNPLFRVGGGLELTPLPVFAFSDAAGLRRSFFSFLVSGRYLFNEQFSCLILVQGIVELVDRWWGFKRSKAPSLALKTDVLWPFHERDKSRLWFIRRWKLRACDGNNGFSTTVLVVLVAFFLPPWILAWYISIRLSFRKSVSSSLQNVNNLCRGSGALGVGARRRSCGLMARFLPLPW